MKLGIEYLSSNSEQIFWISTFYFSSQTEKKTKESCMVLEHRIPHLILMLLHRPNHAGMFS